MQSSDESNRYLLIRTLVDGTPKVARRAASLRDGEQALHDLIKQGEQGWNLFDTKEWKNVLPTDRVTHT